MKHYRQEDLTLGLAMSCLQNWTDMEEEEQTVVYYEVSGYR